MKDNSLKRIILLVLDGFGLAPLSSGNPVNSKNMPFLDSLIKKYRTMTLEASGLVVGLEWGNYGNSEVGHSAMGTGRVVVQSQARINSEIRDGSFFQNQAFLKAISHAKENNSKIHLVGCVSPGGIHSHEDHLFALIDLMKKDGFDNYVVHMITDGEDSPLNQAETSLRKVLDTGAKVATISGRNFAMDRVKNWPLIKKTWDVMVLGKGSNFSSAENYISDSYSKKVFDPDIEPSYFSQDKNIFVESNDSIIFFNYRNDRMKELVTPFVVDGFNEFNLEKKLNNLFLATMTDYSEDLQVEVAYPPLEIKNTLGELVSKNGLYQLRLAEKEKEAHVTNFFNGGRLIPNENEDWVIVPSRKFVGEEYIKHPELSIKEINDKLVEGLLKDYSFILVNYANSDVVAHTGSLDATIETLKIVDKSIERLINSVDTTRDIVIITADHGNAEEMFDPKTNGPDTQHSTSNVPIVIINRNFREDTGMELDTLYTVNPTASLIDVAPTILTLLDINIPEDMTGTSMV